MRREKMERNEEKDEEREIGIVRRRRRGEWDG